MLKTPITTAAPSSDSHRSAGVALALTLLLAALLAWWSVQPPSVLPKAAPPHEFSAARALDDLRVLAASPRATGTAAHAQARSYLSARLTALGFQVHLDRFALPPGKAARLTKRGGPAAATGVNIVAIRPGRNRNTPAVLLMAHYDSVWGSPGAADDGFGLATILETARAVRPDMQQRDFIILLTDGEEIGLAGARHVFALPPAQHPLASRIGVVINLEARGGGGRAMMFQTSLGNAGLIRLYRTQVANPATNSLAVSIYQKLPNSTDLTAALDRGIMGYNIAPIGNPALYHSPLSTADRIDPRTLQHMGSQTLDIVRELLTARQLPERGSDMIFGDLLGLVTIAYPVTAGWAIILACSLLLVTVAVRHRGQWTLAQICWGALEALATALLLAGLVTLLHFLSFGTGPGDYYDRLAALPRFELQAALAAGAVLALLLIRQHSSAQGRSLGFVLLLLTTVTAAQLALPGATPPLAWPLLWSCLSLLLLSLIPRPNGGVNSAIAAAIAIPWLAFLAGYAHFGLLAIGTSAPAVATPLLLPALALLGPLIRPMPRRFALMAAGTLIVGAVGIAGVVRFDARAASVPVYEEKR